MIIHSHPFSPVPRLSPRDRASLDALLPALRATIPTRPHGSIVLGPDWAIGGVVALPSGQLLDVTNAKWVGSPMRKWPLSGSIPKTESMYRSQASLIGERGQFLLSRTTLGIVGVGGGGSHIAQQAARVGFGTIVAIDPDLVEDSNRARMVGSREGDISKPKVGVIRRVVREASKNTNIIIIPEKFPSEKTLAALKECEVIVSCVDTYSARAELNTFSWRHLIPLIDIGIGTEVESSDEGVGLRQLAGHVHVYLPGGPCMWCTGLLSDTRIQLETGGRPEYFRGEGGPGQVISFNGVVASLAVTEAVQLVTGAIFGRHRRLFVQYDGVMPSLPFIDPVRSRSCRVCNGELGRGDTVWK
jgi:molybdopterin/thiamine biosynthesis adenylyltransferase